MTIAITEAELSLMRVLWRTNPLTAREITEQLEPHKDWHRKTVNTLLSRLEKKGALTIDNAQQGAKRYLPNIDKADYESKATADFIDSLFDGELAPLVASFADSRRLSPEQVAELKNLLNEIGDDD